MASVIASNLSNQKTAQIVDCKKCSKAFFKTMKELASSNLYSLKKAIFLG
ncbi:hypothetical protein HMPREF1419_00814 [Helicobacter pylori GAM263BFi]|nr:hypothetical protein HMPREF1419_00814 [Helicobacter pylori GAM263BFi]